ncbi:hypothetical protein [Streptomyces sp. NPDC002588]|uniref:hypothetical protein n=1 Tax=Streptomyces sp. NPDC002588 TaxID=3154419 RepID=UPI003319EABA
MSTLNSASADAVLKTLGVLWRNRFVFGRLLVAGSSTASGSRVPRWWRLKPVSMA